MRGTFRGQVCIKQQYRGNTRPCVHIASDVSSFIDSGISACKNTAKTLNPVKLGMQYFEIKLAYTV